MKVSKSIKQQFTFSFGEFIRSQKNEWSELISPQRATLKVKTVLYSQKLDKVFWDITNDSIH